MRDVLVLLLIASFFVVCVAYVAWCDRIIGSDPASVDAGNVADAVANEEMALSSRPPPTIGSGSVSRCC
jgi:hypothetical protein